ncbi:MAG: hypothetical protein IPK93_07870 [Solirubrobacterales bacterium]|nr:hypothetical protein [Solirubrobacterales bacterium]
MDLSLIAHTSTTIDAGPLSAEASGTLGTVLFFAYFLAAGSILFCVVKGKYGLAILAGILPVVGPVIGTVGAVRLAKPRSLWARYLYDREAMEQAIERHEPPINLSKIAPRSGKKSLLRCLAWEMIRILTDLKTWADRSIFDVVNRAPVSARRSSCRSSRHLRSNGW